MALQFVQAHLSAIVKIYEVAIGFPHIVTHQGGNVIIAFSERIAQNNKETRLIEHVQCISICLDLTRTNNWLNRSRSHKKRKYEVVISELPMSLLRQKIIHGQRIKMFELPKCAR